MNFIHFGAQNKNNHFDKFLIRYGSDNVEAGKKFYILDERGLITKARSNLMELEENFYDLSNFAEDDTSMEGK